MPTNVSHSVTDLRTLLKVIAKALHKRVPFRVAYVKQPQLSGTSYDIAWAGETALLALPTPADTVEALSISAHHSAIERLRSELEMGLEVMAEIYETKTVTPEAIMEIQNSIVTALLVIEMDMP